MLTDVKINALEIVLALLLSILVPLIIDLLNVGLYPDTAVRFESVVFQVATNSMLLMFMAAVPSALQSVTTSIGSWINPVSIIIVIG